MTDAELAKVVEELADEIGCRAAIALCACIGLPPEMRDEEELADA